MASRPVASSQSAEQLHDFFPANPDSSSQEPLSGSIQATYLQLPIPWNSERTIQRVDAPSSKYRLLKNGNSDREDVSELGSNDSPRHQMRCESPVARSGSTSSIELKRSNYVDPSIGSEEEGDDSVSTGYLLESAGEESVAAGDSEDADQLSSNERPPQQRERKGSTSSIELKRTNYVDPSIGSEDEGDVGDNAAKLDSVQINADGSDDENELAPRNPEDRRIETIADAFWHQRQDNFSLKYRPKNNGCVNN